MGVRGDTSRGDGCEGVLILVGGWGGGVRVCEWCVAAVSVFLLV